MAAKAGIFDLIFKSGAKAAKEMSKAAKPAAGGVAGAAKMPKKAAPAKPTPPGRFGPNVKVLPGNQPKRGPMGRMGKYMDETGRPAMINARPLAKKAAPAKKMLPAKPTAEEFARMGRAEAAAKAARMQAAKDAKKVLDKERSAARYAERKAARMPQKPAPAKKAVPVKKTQPYVSKPAAPAFKEPGGRTNRPTMGLKKYPPTKKPR